MLPSFLALVVCLVFFPAPASSGGPSFEQKWAGRIGLSGRCGALAHLGDFRGDGTPEILAHGLCGRDPTRIVLIDGVDGRELWRADFEERVVVATADCLGDARLEVVAASGDLISVLDGATGTPLATAPMRGIVGRIAVGDLDGDSAQDVVYTAGQDRDDWLVALSGADLSEIWVHEAAPEEGRYGDGFTRPVLADVDRDGLDDVLVIENMNVLVRFDHGGRRLWSAVLGPKGRLIPEGAASCDPVAADLTSDGVTEIAVGCFAGALVLVDGATGELLTTSARYGAQSHVAHATDRRIPGHLRKLLAETGEPITRIQALNLDGAPGIELLLTCSDETLYAFNPRTESLEWSFETERQVYGACIPLPTGEGDAPDLIAWDERSLYVIGGIDGGEVRGADPPRVRGFTDVVAGDVDADGTLDLVALTGRENRIVVWSTGVPCAGAGWLPGYIGEAGPGADR